MDFLHLILTCIVAFVLYEILLGILGVVLLFFRIRLGLRFVAESVLTYKLLPRYCHLRKRTDCSLWTCPYYAGEDASKCKAIEK